MVSLSERGRALWNRLTQGSVNRRILGASLTILLATLAVKFVTFAKEIVTAATFGAGDEFDALVIALLIPGFLVNVIGGSLGAALVPIYVDLRERRGQADATHLLARAVVWTAAGLTVLMVALAVGGPFFLPYVATGFSAAKRAMAAELIWWLVPMVVATAVRTLWGAALTAAERFWQMSASAAVSPAITIGIVIGWPTLGVRGVALGLALGAVVEAAWLGLTLRGTGVSLLPGRGGARRDLRRLLGQWVPIMAGSVLMASSTIVDQAMAAALLPGSVARLEYGTRLVAVVTSLGSGVLGVAVVPYFSQLVSRGDFDGLRQVVRRWIGLTVAASLPVVVVLAVWSELIVRTVYERGSFTPLDTAAVAPVQALLALQIPFYVSGIVLVRLASALGAAGVLIWISLGNTILNAVLNLVLIRYMGLAGIALATSVMYAASFGMLWLLLARKHSVRAT